MNANQPAGILASSPEMVETVQRRANGGSYKAPTSNILSNALRSIRGLPTIRQAGNTSGAGMPEFTGTSGGTSMQRQAQMGDAIFGGIDTPEYFRFLESIKDLPYEQQVKALREAGYGATIGSKIEDTSSIFSNSDAPGVGLFGAVKDGELIDLVRPKDILSSIGAADSSEGVAGEMGEAILGEKVGPAITQGISKVGPAITQGISSVADRLSSIPVDGDMFASTGLTNGELAPFLSAVADGKVVSAREVGDLVTEGVQPGTEDTRFERALKAAGRGILTIPAAAKAVKEGVYDAADYLFVDTPYSGRPDADQLNASQRGMSMEDAAGGANAESAPSAAELKKLASEELAETVVQQSNSIAETAAVEKPPANQGGSKVPPTVAASKAMTKKLIARMDAILNNGDLSATPSISKADASKPGTFSAFSNLTATLPKEVDLEGVDKLVKDSLGFDPDQASEDKQGAFWNSVIQAGLNIAAGESSNALTNVAKGLSFGFDTYGKQIGKITDQERADRKEAGMLRLTLINSEKASNVAAAAADTQFKIAIAGAEDTAAQNAITNAYAGQRLEIAALGALATATNQQGSLDVDIYNAETSRLLAKSKETGLDALKSSGLMNSDGSFTEEGLRLLEQTGQSKNTVLTSALTATLGGNDNSGVKQVGSYTPERYVQMVLSNADTKSEMSDQMIETLPQFTSAKPPSDGEIGQYALQQLTKALAPTSVTDLTTPK